MEVTEENFDEVFKPQQNHLDNNASFNGCMYETYGEEVNYVLNLAKTTRKVWTIIDNNDGTMFYLPGFHYVNRIGFLICEVEYQQEQEAIELDCDFWNE